MVYSRTSGTTYSRHVRILKVFCVLILLQAAYPGCFPSGSITWTERITFLGEPFLVIAPPELDAVELRAGLMSRG